MVSIPVRLVKAARRERIRFRHVYAPEPESEPEEPPSRPTVVHPLPAPPEPEEAETPPEFSAVAPVRETIVGEDDAKPVPRSSILKGFQTATDQFAVFRPSEIAALRPRTSVELPILEFVRMEEIDPIYLDVSYFVAPDKGGERPFALLAAALRKTAYAALGTVAIHGREHAVVIRAGRRGLILHTLFYANEVRLDEEWFAGEESVNPKELELATRLVESMESPFDPAKLKDAFEERLRALVESRLPTPSTAAPASRRETPPPSIDILEALRKSLAAKRKPVEPERRPSRSSKPSRERRRRA